MCEPQLPRRRLQRRAQPSRLKLATEMRTDAGLHADQARGHIGKACFDLTTRPLLPQHDCATTIEPTTWNEFLPISMPITAIALCAVAVMACSLSWCPWPVYRWRGRSTAGPSH